MCLEKQDRLNIITGARQSNALNPIPTQPLTGIKL